jgi:heme O synthase-like polyprenyltransferase
MTMEHKRCMQDKQDYKRAHTCLCPRARAQTHARIHKHTVKYIILNCFSTATIVFANAHKCYIIRTLTCLVEFRLGHSFTRALTNEKFHSHSFISNLSDDRSKTIPPLNAI